MRKPVIQFGLAQAFCVLAASILLQACNSSSGSQYPQNFSSGPAATPTPGPTTAGWNPPLPTAPGTNPSFAYIQQNILKPNCDACHSAALRTAGVDVDSYQGLMASNVVVANDPMNSWLYIETSRGSMPLGGPVLSQDDINDIYTWIEQGALDN